MFPTFDLILEHAGISLNTKILSDAWSIKNNVKTGKEYLQKWLASLIFLPKHVKLPYLFLVGPSDSGKSAFALVAEILLKSELLKSQRQKYIYYSPQVIGPFNSVLENTYLLIIEDFDPKTKEELKHIQKLMQDRIILIERKGKPQTLTPNYLHFIHCSNNLGMFKDLKGVTILETDKLEHKIPLDELVHSLEREKVEFLDFLLSTTVSDKIPTI